MTLNVKNFCKKHEFECIFVLKSMILNEKTFCKKHDFELKIKLRVRF